MKNVTLLAVKHAALLLIEANKTTSTLEVKELLRSLDYFAEQHEISTFMDVAAQDLPLSFTTAPGHFRVYTLPKLSTVVSLYDGSNDSDDGDEDDSTDTSASTVTSTVQLTSQMGTAGVSQTLFDAADLSYTSKADELVLMYSSADKIEQLGGTVYRTSVGGGRQFYFAQPIRRELARSAHASMLGIHKNETRSNAVA